MPHINSPEKLYFLAFKLYLLVKFWSHNKNEGSLGMARTYCKNVEAKISIFDLFFWAMAE